MKKLSSLALAAAMALLGVSQASALEVKLTVDDASRITCTLDYEPYTLQTGLNTLNVSDYTYITVKSTEGNIIRSVTNAAGTPQKTWADNWSTSFSSYGAPYDLYINTANLAELRTGTATLTVDDPSKVNVSYNGTWLALPPLQAGANTIHFIPEVETALYIAATDYYVPLYRVTLNGNEVPRSDNNFNVPLTEGAQINVESNFPDIQEPVTFSFLNDGAEFVTQVLVDNVEVTNYLDPGFTVKCGSKLTIKGNTNDYKFNKIDCNGSISSYMYTDWSSYITGPTQIIVDAERYPMYDFTLNIDDPAHILVYRGYEYQNDQITGLVAGANALQVKSSESMLVVKPQAGCFITSLSINGEVQQNSGSSYYVYVNDNDVIDVVTGEIARDDRLALYINDKSLATSSFYFYRNDRSEIAVESGYNMVNFCAQDVPFNLSAYGATTMKVYKNNVIIDPFYTGGTAYELNVENNDCVKVFFNEDPQLYNVTFNVAADAGELTGTYDLVRTLNFTDGVQAFPSTAISIASAEGKNLSVKVNNAEVTPEEGAYVFTTGAEDTQVEISAGGNVGVDEINIEGNSTVYNMQGIPVMRNASAADIKNLPAGLYIINGKKIRK